MEACRKRCWSRVLIAQLGYPRLLQAVLLVVAFLAVLAPEPAHGQIDSVRITELMAVNNTTIVDEDKSFSDWIELYNSGTNVVNLGGWYLANSAANLTKWQFPATNLGPSRFLIVFASGKDRRLPGAPLHANFKLSGSGEYLALVLPDGVTKVSEFAPAFPPQFSDVSYGYVMTGAVSTLVAPDASARALVPVGDIGTGWRLAGYNDSSWVSGKLGAGFDVSGNYASAIGLDLRSRMLNVSPSAYIRVPFSVSDPAAYNALTLRLRYDDGFVAYLNGTAVATRNAPASPAWSSAATASHGAPSAGLLSENFEGSAANYTLSQFGDPPGPALQNAGPGSTGKFLSLLYDGINGAANSISFRQTAPGLFETIVADFDFRVSDAANNPADGFCFLLIPTALYGTNGPGVNTSLKAAEEPNYQGAFGIGFDVYPHSVNNDVSVHWNGTEVVNVTMPPSAIDLAAGVFHHAKVTLQHVAGGARVTVSFTPDINGSPGPLYAPITNFFVAGLNPFDCRVQFGGRTGGLNLGLDLDNCSVQFVPPQGPIAFEEFDLSGFLNRLVPGSNVLAVQGLNISASNSNFLAQPELLGRRFYLASTPGFLNPATPGTWNSSSSSLEVPAVTFWPPGGAYPSNLISVSLGSSSSSAIIRYTLDGSAPATNSPVFSAPLVLSSNATIRARAELNGVLGEVAAQSYFLLDPSLTNFNSNLPLVMIDAMGQAIPDGDKVRCYGMFIDTNTPTGRTTLVSPADYAGSVALGLHGNSSLQFPKKPYNVELQDETGDGLNWKLLGLPAHSDWLLYPSYDDKTLMNNVLTQEIYESMGHYAVRRKYVELFLHSGPGKVTMDDYAGIYILLERIRVDDNRVNIAKLSSSDNALPEVSGGYLFEKDRPEATDVTVATATGPQLIVLYPKAAKITAEQHNYLQGYINQFETALYGADWRDPLTGYRAYIDSDSFVDYHWMVEYPKNIDGVRLSNHFHKDRNGKIKNAPIWDWDLSWGNANYAEGGKTNGWYYPLMGDADDLWLRRLRTDPDFYQKIIDRWGELRAALFHPTNLFARIDRLTNYLHEAQARDFARWPRLGTYVWPNPNGAAGGWDVDYVSPTTYDGIIAQFKSFVRGRYAWVDEQFLPAPVLSTNWPSFSLAAPLGTIYYTLDGSDPRGSGGGISRAARTYAGPVLLATNAGIVARAYYTNTWSPPVNAVFVTAAPELRITEINYHPAAPPTNYPYSDDDFEFLEVENTGAGTLNLAGVRIGGGIDFTFAPNVLAASGNPTVNGFEGSGTAFVASRLGALPPAYLTNGPSGTMLSLLNSGTNITRNRLSFQQTTATNCDRIIADFDFRASTRSPASASRPGTVQNFDAAGTAYALANSGTTAPAILPADSGSSGSFLRLVPSAGSQAARIAFDRTATGTVSTVVATFDFRVTPPSEQNQADGFGFALLSTASYGTTGTGSAFSEEPNLTGSIGVGFDVYNNGTSATEPNNNHISLHWNRAIVGIPAIPSFDFSNGKFHRAQIIVSFSGNNAYVTVKLTPDINGTPGATETVMQNVLISGASAYESRVAFGARTGGAWAAQDLDNIDVQFIPANVAAAAGLSLLLLPTSEFSASGVGSSLSTFTDLPLATNTLALDLSFNSSNLVNETSFYWNGALASSTSVSPALADLDNGLFYHVRLQLDGSAGGVYATLVVTPNSLGTPGQPITIVSNRFVAGARLPSSRLEFAARNGGLVSDINIDNVQATFQVLAPLLLSPGESIVVVRNLPAFVSRYGTGIRVAGEYSGQLDNAGDRLRLYGPVGEPILDFRYEPSWYPITDGAGFSLVAVDPSAPAGNWGLPQNWRPSGSPLGSPGSGETQPAGVQPIRINEVLANSVPPEVDWVELFNPTIEPVNIGGWFISDSMNRPQQFRIPDNTWIAPGGYVAFTETDFNVHPGFAGTLGLNSEGDDVLLFSALTNGLLTGYVQGFDFGPSDEGVSFGRYVNSVGEEHFVAQTARSFQGANAGPLVGPVVISEIMYHPAQTGANTNDFLQYIELENISAVPVPLYSPSLPLNTWRLRNAVQYDFPPSVVLDPGKRILIVGFDPDRDSAGLAAFRSAYPATISVPLFGPWDGRLSDTDERIELRKPGQLTASGSVPSVLVEAVHYHSAPPWPTNAADLGNSLQRSLATAYGNDPTNWFASGSSPGLASFSNQPPVIVLTSPANGQSVLFPDAIWLRCTANDPDGRVTRVEFYVDGLSVGAFTNSPYQVSCNNLPAGTHRVIASATDNSGNLAVSAPATIDVVTPTLSIFRSGANIDLAWPSNSGNYRLQMATNLTPPLTWLSVSNTPVFVGNDWRVNLTPSSNGARFYRLQAQ